MLGSVVLALGLALAGQAHAVPGSADGLLNSADTLSFDVPAQNMGDALDAYSRQSQVSIVTSAQIALLWSAGVRGSYTRKQALSTLLGQHGLAAYFLDNRSVVIRFPDPAANQPAVPLDRIPGVRTSLRDHGPYVGRLQQQVHASLCETALTRPGSYRLALQLWVSQYGHIQRVWLLGSTGAPSRDQAIERRLHGLSLGEQPDAQLPQPILLLLLPAAPPLRSQCPARVQGR